MSLFRRSSRSVLPGFGLTLGFTILYLSLIVLVPLSAVFVRTSGLSWEDFGKAVTSPFVVSACKVSFGASFAAALVNAVFGLVVAWVLTRYPFPGKKVIDALVDLPFALPTAVAGIALTAIYSKNGWVGRWIDPQGEFFVRFFSKDGFLGKWFGLDFGGIQIAYAQTGVFVALTFIGLPFVVRTLQPVIEELEPELEEASATLGANRWQTLRRVIFPQLVPALVTGFALAFARALGEFGSVVFIGANLPMKTQIVPHIIYEKLEQYDYAGATAIASVMLVASFVLLLVINLLQKWSRRHHAV
ncbi:MAG: sulfate ABC transporter permease subunit CysT [Opitutaceae bacterium]|jgi:sulfate transport system permease protein|nr:sulfate ABC transporter permease subunit CysT [Opitutaceae bacterium]